MTLHQKARKIEIMAQTLMDFRKETLKEAAKIAGEYANNYPTDIFVEPPAGQHGQTVDACSARAARHTSKMIAQDIRKLLEDE